MIKKVFKVVKNQMMSFFKKELCVMNSNQTIDYIIKNKISVGRFGDGELILMDGGDIRFQDGNVELSNKLKEVKTTDNFLVCIPDIFNKKTFNKRYLKKEEYFLWQSVGKTWMRTGH